MVDSESRAYLQERLVVLSRLLFWSFVALLAGMVMLYRTYPQIEPARNNAIYSIAIAGMVVLGSIWRGVLVRRPLAVGWLHAIDLFYGASTGTIFASAAYL